MNFGDLDKFSKLCYILVVPMFSVALYQDFGLWVLQFIDALEIGVASEYRIISVLAKAVAFFGSVAVVAISFHLIDTKLFEYKPFIYFFSLSLISFGLLGIGSRIDALAVEPNKLSNHLLYWQLASLCWGFHIFYKVEVLSNEDSEKGSS
ncbi:hypothetical protein [Pseudoalteromonas rubra]|uniref:hypothetical protein n=1 Tax=Pseudoalteromonas rubra TaxID=43658 RepID=UPI002DBF4E5E|nr:hypothetical protein [Pseudoalteromonas rubra]MEC4090908.1 hypothetical protein [Pseudoalteromonas rubra]